MKASQEKIEEFISKSKTQFFIPVYQRNYDWQKKHCQQLWDDILISGKEEKTHFFGSIVFMHDSVYQTNKIKRLEIIDGQQRLTTLTLLLLAIYKFLEKQGEKDRAEEIYNTYLINPYAKSEEKDKIKLKATENNQQAIQFLLQKNKEEYPEYSNVINNYDFFKKKINIQNIEILLRGLNFLIFVEVSLEKDKDDTQKIFESFNSTGLALSQADLIRNYILMSLKREEQEIIYSDYWIEIEKNARDKDKNKDLVSNFIRDYITSEKNNIPKKSGVYEEYKKTFPFESFETLESELEKIKLFSTFYSKFINPPKEQDSEIKEELENIKKLEVTVSYPFLLKVYYDYQQKNISKEILLKVLFLIQSFVWRRYIVGLPTSALNKLFMNLYSKIDNEDYYLSLKKELSKKGFPKNHEIEEQLKIKDLYNTQKGKGNTKYFLEKLENYNNKEKVNIENLTIEHIFPQKAHKWKKELDEKNYQKMEDKLHTIGNLTLSGNNGALGNNIFLEKKCYTPNGYADSRLWLNSYLQNLEKWNNETLAERENLIYKRFLEIWEEPLEISKEEILKGEVNLYSLDKENLAGKKITYIKFLDEIIKEKSSNKDYYLEFFKILFDMEEERIVNSELATKISLKQKKEIKKENQEYFFKLKDNYYIRTNSSTERKFELMKYALDFFELEEDCFVKFEEQ